MSSPVTKGSTPLDTTSEVPPENCQELYFMLEPSLYSSDPHLSVNFPPSPQVGVNSNSTFSATSTKFHTASTVFPNAQIRSPPSSSSESDTIRAPPSPTHSDDMAWNSDNETTAGSFGEQDHPGTRAEGMADVSGGARLSEDCSRCGQPGHDKHDCPNSSVQFAGVCRECGATGHKAAECPVGNLPTCGNCLQKGHTRINCVNKRFIDRSNIETLTPEAAWQELKDAVKAENFFAVANAADKYIKAKPDFTILDMEKALRAQSIKLHIIAISKELSLTYTNMDFQGNLNKRYTATFQFASQPRRNIERAYWPTSAEDNMARLADAGVVRPMCLPVCFHCNVRGHSRKNCPDQPPEPVEANVIICSGCNQIGHQLRDCPNPRKDQSTCRKCNKPGHFAKDCPEPGAASDVQCRKCGIDGHYAKDCPTGSGDTRDCRNCGQVGHIARECTEPVNMTKIICRNCDAMGHIAKNCPEPRNWSRVKCLNCGQMGHTKVRCSEPIANDDSTSFEASEGLDDSAPYNDGGMW